MKQTLQTKSLFTALLLFVFSLGATAQLVVTVTPLDALCTGTGRLALGVTGNDPAGIITFTVYSGPNASGSLVGAVTTTVPYTPPYYLNNLNAGTYTVVATQVLNGVTTTSESVTQVITNSSESATYNTTIRGTRCGPDGSVIINTERGAPIRYELYAGFPIPAGATPIATSVTNNFSGLAQGVYTVRVYDACERFADVTVRIQPETTNVTVSPVQWPVNHITLTLSEDWHLDACDRISPQHRIYTNRVQEIFYPLTITYTITDPSGNVMPERFTQVIPNGDPYDQYFRAGPIPFFECQAYSYDMVVRDACGNPFSSLNNRLEECYDVVGSVSYGHCDESITYSPINYVLPYTTVITYAPPVVLPGETPPNPPLAFNPEDHSDEYPTFTGPGATFNNHVPNGTYTALVTDACGRAVTVPNTIVDLKPIELILSGTIPCGATEGVITGAFTNAPTNFVHVNIVAPFPPGYSGPTNLDSGINPLDPSAFAYGPLPVGVYTIAAEHECGETLTVEVTFAPSTAANPIFAEVRPGCEVGMSSVNIYSNENRSGVITGVEILSGPEEWRINNPGTDPVDVSQNLFEGQFFMNSFPEGEYVFNIIDDCGERQFTYNLEGYRFTERSAQISTTDCASFGISIDVQGANNATTATYWLQKKNAAGLWSSPINPANVYVEGATPVGNYFDVDPALQPANGNSLRLRAPGLAGGVYTPGFGTGSGAGEFRVIEVYSIFGNGVDSGARCVTVLAAATLGLPPVIDGAFSFPCANTGGEIIVSASVNGSADGLIYRVDNGPEQTSNVFSGLVEGQSYTFYVTDANRCNTVNIVAQIQPAPQLVISQNGACENQLVTLSLPQFNFLNYEWFRANDPTNILSTSGTLSFPSFTSSVNAGEYQVRITNPDNADSCLNQTLSYTLGANVLPNAGVDSLNNARCTDANAQPIDLNTLLTAPFDQGGIWTNVATGAVITGGSFNIAAVTTDSVINFAYTITDSCGNTDVATVRFTISETPVVPVITGPSLVCEGARVQLTAASTTPGVTYAWTTPNGAVVGDTIDIPATLAAAGVYTVTATSASGSCLSTATQTVTVTALVTAGDDVNVPATCSDATANVLDLNQFITASATTGGTFTVGTNAAPGTSFDGVSNFDTANLVGTFDFIYSVTACGITDTALITFTINQTPAAPVATVDAAVVCENGTIQLNTPAYAGTGTVTYVWSGPNGFTSALQNPTVPATLAAAGDYSLTLIVDNCTSDPSVPVNVAVTPLPQFSLTGNTVICPTQSTTLSVAGLDGANTYTYEWTLNGGVISTSGSVTVDQLGDYVVTVSNGSCTSPAQTIKVTADPDPFTVVLESNCINDRFIVSISNIESIGTVQSIVWDGPGVTASTSTTFQIDLTDFKEDSTYGVTVTNADGCFKTQTIDVERTKCSIPKGISPNGDDKNNEFDLTNLKVQNLQIFNRYGLQVYEKNNYTKEWYGQSDKGDLPTGTYFYVAKMADRQVTGWVYIQREQ